MTEEKSDDPKIIVDEDWKSQVEAEKEQIKKESEEVDDATGGEGELPPASFAMLLTTLGSQALASLGQLPDPMTQQAMINKPIAKHMIDTLGVLEEKTKGNLTEDEAGMLENLLHQLRMIYVATPDEMPTGDSDAGESQSSIELP